MTVDGWGWIKWKILKGACGRIRRGIYDIDVTVALNKTFSLNFRCGNSVAVYLFFPLRRRHFPNFCAIAQISNTKEAKESIQVTPRFVITTRLTNKNQTTKCIVLLRLSRLLFLLGFCWFISVSLNFFFLDTRKVVGKVVRVKIVQCLSGFCLLTSTERERGKWAIEKAVSFYENFSSFSWKSSPIDGERDKRKHFELFDVTWENIYM